MSTRGDGHCSGYGSNVHKIDFIACTVSRAYSGTNKGKEEGTEKVFLSPRKHMNIPEGTLSLDDFKNDILRRNVSE
jgi:hypothetical protein